LLAILLLTSTSAADVTGVYFGADYCQPCRSLRPSLARLQRAYVVNHVDAGDANQSATCQQYGVTTIPQIVFLSDGVEIDRIVGTSPDWQRRCEDRLSGRNNWRPIRAAVRVRTPGGMGSGVILSSVPGRTVIATAAHMVRDASAQVSVDVFLDGGRIKTYPATVVSSNDTTDLALVLVVANTFPLPAAIGANDSPGQGDVAFGIGCSGGGRVSVMKCRVLRIQDGDVFCSGAPAQGRSGGGLYNSRFELIGICSAQNKLRNDGWYVNASKLRRLLEEWEPAQYRSGFGIGLGVGMGVQRAQPAPCRTCIPIAGPPPPRQIIGPRGATGARGPQGPPGVSPDLTPLIRRIEVLEKMKRPVVLVDGKSGTKLDSEEYANGEAIVIDVQALNVK
jgi:S1-C subfamily serine protease